MKLIIENGTVVDPKHNINKQVNIAISNDKISYVDNIPAEFSADKKIDATGQIIFPGIIDLCNRPELKHPHGTTLVNESQAALRAGITTICIPPDCDPVIDSPASAERLLKQQLSLQPTILPQGALTNGLQSDSLADLTSLQEAGCVAFSNAQAPINDLGFLHNIYKYAASFNLKVFIQPQNYWLAKNGVAHEGKISTRFGLAGIPELAETVAIAEQLLLIEQTGISAHFSCLSSYKGACLIKQAKQQGLPITADVAMHSLHLTEMDVCDFNTNCHLYPPLRTEADRDGLIAAVADGTIDAICTDHRPLNNEAKLAPFSESIPGITATDTFLSLGIKLVNDKKLTLEQLIAAITTNPAKILGTQTGEFAMNSPADLVFLSTDKYWQVSSENIHSHGKNSPFIGWDLPGEIVQVMKNGMVAFN